jgi:hypothetical protein
MDPSSQSNNLRQIPHRLIHEMGLGIGEVVEVDLICIVPFTPLPEGDIPLLSGLK